MIYESWENYAPILFICLCVYLVIDKIKYVQRMYDMRKLRDAIEYERKALKREMAELEYKYRTMR